MWQDVVKRPFITVGFTAFVLLIPLAITSTAGWIRRLGGKRWQMLHRLIYATAVLGVIHFYWSVKSDVRKPLEYAFFVGILLAWRMGSWLMARRKRAVPRTAARQDLVPQKRFSSREKLRNLIYSSGALSLYSPAFSRGRMQSSVPFSLHW